MNLPSGTEEGAEGVEFAQAVGPAALPRLRCLSAVAPCTPRIPFPSGGGGALRNLRLLCQGHAIDPLWAIAHDPFLVCQRVLAHQADPLPLFRRVWDLRQGRRLSITGPVGNLFAAAKHLGLSWP